MSWWRSERPSTGSGHRELVEWRRVELAVFGLALALRLAWVAVVELRGGALFGPDAPSYDALAMNLLRGNGLQMEAWGGLSSDPEQTVTVRAFRPPLLPVILAGIYGVFGHRYAAARVAMALLSAATCVVVLRIARRLFGPGGQRLEVPGTSRPEEIAAASIADCRLPIADFKPGSVRPHSSLVIRHSFVIQHSEFSILLAGLLMAVYPKFIYYGGEPVTETLCTLLLALAVWALLAAFQGEGEGQWHETPVPPRSHRVSDSRFPISDLTPRTQHHQAHLSSPIGNRQSAIGNPYALSRSHALWLSGGVLLALAALARSSLLAFPAAAALWILLARKEKARALKEAGLLAGGFLLAMTPWWVRNATVFGRFVPATTEAGYTLWVTNNERATGGGHCFLPEPPGEFDGLTEYGIDRLFQSKGARYIREHPGHFLRLAWAKFVRFWRLWPHAEEPHVGLAAAVVGGLSFTPILLLALWGAVVARPLWRPLLLFCIMFGYYTALHMVYMAITRYRVPIEPYLIVLAACGLADLARRWRPE